MTLLSGWCTAPPGARPQHERCTSAACLCNDPAHEQHPHPQPTTLEDPQ